MAGNRGRSRERRRDRSAMTLPIPRSYAPMEARIVAELPEGEEWQYEPKWDGFRCLAFRDGDSVDLQSKSGQPLARYFPELVEAFKRTKAKRFVVDGEIVISEGKGFSFDSLLQRIHPAASRIKKLSAETPSRFLAFDLLVDERGTDLTKLPLEERRRHLERLAKKSLVSESIVLSPATTKLSSA